MNPTIDKLKPIIARIHSEALRETCESLLTDEAFLKAPASVKHHHAYTGGLAAHTAEVAEIAFGIAASGIQEISAIPDRDVLLTAALWHDYCKIHDYVLYESATEWTYSTDNYHRRIGHITGSVLAFYQRSQCECNTITQSRLDAIAHAMLAHHGPVREWGSPVAPQTIEAMILHQADMLSAKYGMTK